MPSSKAELTAALAAVKTELVAAEADKAAAREAATKDKQLLPEWRRGVQRCKELDARRRELTASIRGASLNGVSLGGAQQTSSPARSASPCEEALGLVPVGLSPTKQSSVERNERARSRTRSRRSRKARRTCPGNG